MISVIIVLYNSKSHIYNCLDNLKKSLENINHEIIIINNNKSDSYTFDDTFVHPDNILIQKENIGYAKAINKGINHSKGDCFLLLNPDTMVNDDTIINLYSTLNKNNKIGIVGGKAVDFNGKYINSSMRRFPYVNLIVKRFLYKYLNIGLNKYNYFDFDANCINNVDSISGACMLFNKKIFMQLKGFDERFFLYFEDTDFCLRAKKLMYEVLFVPTKYVHLKGGSINRKNKIYVRFLFYSSMLKFIIKYRDKYKFLFIYLFLLLMLIIL